jgi:hypothetical protein
MATTYQPLPGMPYFMQIKSGSALPPINYTAAQFRDFTAALAKRTGVLGSSDFIVAQMDNVGFGIKVNSGYIRVGGAGSNYLVRLGSDVNMQLPTLDYNPPSDRVHGVYVGVYDGVKSITADEYVAQLIVTENTGSGIPVPGGDVAAYSLIATITIKPNTPFIQNSNIDNSQRRHGGSAGEYLPLLLANNMADASADPGVESARPRAIYSENGFVRLGGTVKRLVNFTNPVFDGDNDYVIGSVHPNLRPTHTRYLLAPCSINKDHANAKTGSYTCRLKIESDGVMTVAMPAGNAPQYVMFDGVTYDLDGDSL